MEKGAGLDLQEEFNNIDFNSKWLEQRFVRTMETLASQPDKSIWLCSENRAEASETMFPQQSIGSWPTTNWTGKKSYELIGNRPYSG